MKFQQTTLILVLLAFGLGGFVYFYEIQGSSKREAAQAKQNQLFTFDKAEIKRLTIKSEKETLEFEQFKKNKDSFPQWQMKQPTDTLANDASIAFLVNLLVNTKNNSSFTGLPNNLQEYGLDKPLATVEIKLKNQKNYQLILGKQNFDKSFLYAQAKDSDNKNQEIKILLVPLDFQYAVNRPLSEWKEQPEPQNTDKITPSPSPQNSSQSPNEKLNQETPATLPEKSNKETPVPTEKTNKSSSPH